MSVAECHYAEYPMANIPAGEEHLRDDRIKKSWTIRVDAFRLAPVPVTKALFGSIMHQAAYNHDDMQLPVTEVSWQEAIAFCNSFSRTVWLKECYATNGDGEVIWNKQADGYRLPTEAEW